MKTKRIFVLLLSLLMILPLGLTAFAAGDVTTGTIKINGVLKGNDYSIYKILDLSFADETTVKGDSKDSYSYTIKKADNPMFAIVKDLAIDKDPGSKPDGTKVFKLTQKTDDTNVYYVTLETGIANDETTAKKIAPALLAAIKDHNTKNPTNIIKPTKKVEDVKASSADGITIEPSIDKDGSAIADRYNITFSGLDFGYYLIDTTAGTMIGLTSTDPEAEIDAKNKLPKLDKEVYTFADANWKNVNSMGIGETVRFRITVEAQNGAHKYIVYDKMDKGLAFKRITKIYYGAAQPSNAEKLYEYDANNAAESEAKLKDLKELTITYKGKDSKGNDIPVYGSEVMDFKIEFNDAFMQRIYDKYSNQEGTNKVFIEYEGVVTEEAVIGGNSATDDGNQNTAKLVYGDNSVFVSESKTKTFVYKFNVVKTDNADTAAKVLTGAQFKLYRLRDNTNGVLSGEVKFVDTGSTATNGAKIYRIATQEEIDDGTNIVDHIEAGNVEIQGVGAAFNTDGRTYYLKETKAPDGFNVLPNPVEVKITDGYDSTASVTNGIYQKDSGGIQVVNQKGTLLPETGGIGTTIFYIVGGVLLVGAAVLLITKRRMSALKESK